MSFPFITSFFIIPLLFWQVLSSANDSSDHLFKDIVVSAAKSCSMREPFVYGFMDLFSGSGESWHWGIGMDENKGIVSSVNPHTSDGLKLGREISGENVDKNVKPLTVQEKKQSLLPFPAPKLESVKEEHGEFNKSRSSTDSNGSAIEESLDNDTESKSEVSHVCMSWMSSTHGVIFREMLETPSSSFSYSSPDVSTTDLTITSCYFFTQHLINCITNLPLSFSLVLNQEKVESKK